MLPARINIVTIGARNMAEMRAFYRGLGWKEQSDSDDHAMFHMSGSVLSLFPSPNLAADAAIPYREPEGFPNFSLAINLESRDAVDDAFAELRRLGVVIVKEPEEVFWGGYSGYFADPEGNLWEIAWNPYSRLDERGALVLSE